jgi:lambda family phage portal protein
MATRKQKSLAVTTASGGGVVEQAYGGGIEGASRTSREMLKWVPPIVSPDQQINHNKELMDARGRDSVQNDGLITGAVHVHRDSIVGAQFRLVSNPNYKALGASEAWAKAFKEVVESRFNLMAESVDSWFDAGRCMTFTDMIRLGVGGFVFTGEVLATCEWQRDQARPFNTCFQMVSPTRLSNPNGTMDDANIRAGIERDIYGRPQAYWIRQGFPGDFMQGDDQWKWRRVPAYFPWGRRQVIHIKESLQAEQTRGVADMVSALKDMKMTRRFSEITLQNAIVNATYAAAVESELPSEVVFASMGAGGPGLKNALSEYMAAMTSYVNGSNNISIDGVKMPHLFPGTKLNLKTAGTPGGIGQSYEESLLRRIAAPLGISAEQFTKDFSKSNYAGARASMSETEKFMRGRKKTVADKQATMMYVCWLEEEINRKDSVIPLPKNFNFYDPYMREALVACTWIGAGQSQIDETKETQAALMRIKGGLSTYQDEIANLGKDYRAVFQQRASEEKLIEELGLSFSLDATKPGTNDRQQTMQDANGNEDDQPPARKQKEKK